MIATEKGYIYLLQSNDAAIMKIGCSKSIDSRLKALKVPSLNTLVDKWLVPEYKACEKALHKLYSKRRLPQAGKEWFLITDKELPKISKFIANWIANYTELPVAVESSYVKPVVIKQPVSSVEVAAVKPLPVYKPRPRRQSLFESLPPLVVALSCLIPPIFLLLLVIEVVLGITAAPKPSAP